MRTRLSSPKRVLRYRVVIATRETTRIVECIPDVIDAAFFSFICFHESKFVPCMVNRSPSATDMHVKKRRGVVPLGLGNLFTACHEIITFINVFCSINELRRAGMI
jgi:hypothetical protein